MKQRVKVSQNMYKNRILANRNWLTNKSTKRLVSKDTALLRRWESERQIWIYQLS